MNQPAVPTTSRRSYQSIRGRIVITSTIFATFLAIVIAVFSYVFFMRTLTDTQQTSVESNLQIVGAELDLAFERVTNYANWCTIDTSMTEYLAHMRKVDQMTKDDKLISFTAWKLLNEEYIAAARGNYVVRTIITTRDGAHYLQTMQGASQPSSVNIEDNILHTPWFDELADADNYIWRLVSSKGSGGVTNSFFPVVRPVRRSTSSDVLGYVFLEVSQGILTDPLNGIQLEDDAQLFLTIDGETFEYRKGKLTPAEIPDGAITHHLSKVNFALSMLPSSKIYREQRIYYLAIAALIFASIFMAVMILSLSLRRVISTPVDALLKKTQRVGAGDFTRDPGIEWNNELGDIGKGINDLSENVSALMDKKVQDEKQRQELEYKILQSQVNPHFLYNTLNTIKWMATIQGSDGIADMSTSLSRLLKNVAKGTKTLIPLRDELQLVNDYFTIMKYRYGGTIELEVTVDSEDLNDYLVNRFSLQPIVENAIFHGIEPKGSAGTIRIHAHLAGEGEEAHSEDSLSRQALPGQALPGQTEEPSAESLQIDVLDNGVGMDEETARKILTDETSSPTDFFKQVGVANVNQRIQYAFGERYGLSIDSTVGEGTCVTMTLPCRIEQANEI